MVEKFKKLYNEIVIPYLNENFEYKNIQEIPKIKKIQINRCLGLAAQNTKIFKKSIDELSSISGQYPKITKSKKYTPLFLNKFRSTEFMPVYQ